MAVILPQNQHGAKAPNTGTPDVPNGFNMPDQGKRKLSQTTASDKVRTELNLSVSPDGSILISPEAKKLKSIDGIIPIKHVPVPIVPVPNNTTGHSTCDSEPVNNNKSGSSDGYDTEDNCPLSQLTENDLVNTPTRPRNNLLRKTLKRRAVKGEPKNTAEEESEVDVPRSPSTNNNLLTTLQDIRKSIKNLEEKQEQTTISLMNLQKQVKDAMDVSASKAELIEQGEKVLENTERINSLCDGLSSMSVRTVELKKHLQDTDMNMAKNFSKIEGEKMQILKRIEALEEKSNKIPCEKERVLNMDHEQMNDKKVKNIILEGLNEITNEDVYDTTLRAIREIGINIYDNDINKAYRIGTFKGFDIWPRPIRVELVSERVRDKIMENRLHMANSPTHYRVRISNDEPKETRKARAILRKTATKAQMQGKRVKIHQNSISIDNTSYTLQDAAKLETPYRAALLKDPENDRAKKTQHVRTQDLPEERRTKKGLAFFTARSKKSCFYPRTFKYDNEEHKTPEHAFQWKKAMTSNLTDLAKQIKDAQLPARAKNLGARIPYNPIWEGIKDDEMEKILWEKHSQHRDLGDELCETEGLTLMEASPTDRHWGTGCLITDPAIENGNFPGRNELGKRLEKVRDRLLTQKSSNDAIVRMDFETSAQLPDKPPTTNVLVGVEIHQKRSSPTLLPATAGNQLTGDVGPKPIRNPAESARLRASAVSIEDSQIEVLEKDIIISTTARPRRETPNLDIWLKEDTIVVSGNA